MNRNLALWLGSFLIAVVVLRFYFQVPVLPLLLAGGITLAVTVIRYRLSHKR